MKKDKFKLPILDDPAFIKFSKIIKEYDVGDPASPFYRAIEDFGNCEILHRKSERAKKLKLPKADYYENIAMLHNTQGLRKLQSAKVAINKTIKRLPPGPEKKISHKEMKARLDEYEIMFKNEIFEEDFTPEESELTWASFGKAKKALVDKGTIGLLEYMSSNIDKLIDSRKDLKKGRQFANPIHIWKVNAIAIYTGIQAFVLIWCFCTSDCIWALAPLPAQVVAIMLLLHLAC